MSSLHITLLCCLLRAHWYLVVICFPGLEEPKFEAWTGPASKAAKSHSGTDESQDQEEAQGSKSPNNNTETPPTINHNDKVDAETGLFGFYAPRSLHSSFCACFKCTFDL